MLLRLYDSTPADKKIQVFNPGRANFMWSLQVLSAFVGFLHAFWLMDWCLVQSVPRLSSIDCCRYYRLMPLCNLPEIKWVLFSFLPSSWSKLMAKSLEHQQSIEDLNEQLQTGKF
ncbi:hypothetical protein GOODEAATRI_031899 [Goodea atripinnis]|uniref:Uncharacterized protein n=1 Tax=Goodea atripinnis TaxID=208336 RepID=A0ABV0MWU4_9TELE